MIRIEVIAALTAASLLTACATSGGPGTAESSEGTASAGTAVVTQEATGAESGLGPIVYGGEDRRDCRRKMRRTGTRIPRGVCDSSTFSEAFHMPESGGLAEDTAGGNSN